MQIKRDASTASAFTKFRLLMWKNFLQQWRHRWQTLIELILPVGTMALVLILRMEIEPVNRDVMSYPPIPAHTFNYSLPVLTGMNITELSIAYSPTSPVLEDVMRTAVVDLFILNIKDIITLILDQISEFPDIPIEIPPDLNFNSTLIYEIAKSLVKVQAYDNSHDLRGIYIDEIYTRKVLAAVEFDDDLLGTTELPKDVKYALRFPERPRLNSFLAMGGLTWRTDDIFPFFQVPGPRFPFSWEGGNDPGYVNELFIALQHSISMELVSRLTNTNLKNFTVNIQRYPHPSFVEDLAVEALNFIFPMFVMISFSYTAVNIVRAVTLEKENQLKEIMKIMGLPTWLHWTAWFFKQFIYMFIIAGLLVMLLKINWFTNEEGFSDYAVFTNTPWTVLLFFITLYLTCMVFFCFMLSGFFSKASTAALFTGVIWFLTYVPSFLLSMETGISPYVQALTCLTINSAMSYGFQLLISEETLGGMTWGNFFSTHTLDSNRFLFGHVVIMLAVNCVLYMLIALYLEQVLPGPWGTPQPWYFPFQKSFWFPSSVVNSDISIDNIETSVVNEDEPIGHEVGVKIINLTKVYGKNIAVNNLSLNIYDDQITVLLGHNGAGKSTTISMLTGNVPITKGSVCLAGYNISHQLQAARAHLGLCPQHNVLFNELTVHEHLEFFARLKGFSGKELETEINTIIEKLEMQEKRNYIAEGLSGGQKRRLCVGIALSGGARVVLLDEPTSGMDPASRRALWDLLEKEKKGRSMILTTHFMDEADYLGDRVAIMSSGSLQCMGSPYFLKNYYGVGYTLVVVKSEGFQLNACTHIIDKYIAGTVPKDDDAVEVTYKLPTAFRHVFEDLLNELEQNADSIHYKNYGLIATTLEDVFMSVGSDVEITSVSDDTATIGDSCDDLKDHGFDASSVEHLDKSNEKETGSRLLWLQVKATWYKLFLVWSRSWGLLILQILVPVLQINISLGITTYILVNRATVIPRLLSLVQGYASTETILSFNGTDTYSLGGLAKAGYELIYRTAGLDSMELIDADGRPTDEFYLNMTEDPVAMGVLRNKILIGATFNDNSATAWFSNFGYHDVATSLATVHSALLKGIDAAANLTVYNHPLEANYRDDTNMQLMLSLMSMQVATAIGNSLAIASAVYIMFYIKERVIRAKLLQRAAGVQPVVMWGAAAVFDWVWFLILSVTVVISCAAFQVVGCSTVEELGRMYLCLMVYGAAMLPLHYLFSLVFNGPAVGFVLMFFVNILFGLMGAQIVETLQSPVLNTGQVATIMDYILQFFPLYSLVTSVRSLNHIGMTEYSCLEFCDYLLSTFPNLQECTMQTLCDNISQSCCVRENPYFDWEEPGVMRYLLSMVITGVVLWVLMFLLEYNLLQRVFTWSKHPPAFDPQELDPDVASEVEHAQRTSPDKHRLLARGLSKYYKKNLAVDQLSFTVGEGECFGLLGVNGAGKTSTFKMLMGDESVSSGDAYVCGYSVKTDLGKVYEHIGYCPQFDAVYSELTGRETLRLFSTLRGIREPHCTARALMLAHALGFTKHLDKRVDQYSGGNKRKLSTALSLLGGARLVFVDEPTTGVDPAAKRQVWRALRSARRANTSFVLTSHSMEECEALCSRLTVMVRGRFQCLGSPQYLKNKFSQGFTLTIKVKALDNNQVNTPVVNSIELIKGYVSNNFNSPRLMEEYQGLITYYLPDRTVSWSRMFGIMERAKRELPIEDYSILQTSLEQIFLQFTKYTQEDTPEQTSL
ncbi:ATP-binding cassette sub-family A member 3-like [Zerene cesonia]|uniref:ATP-binding cassette sub-family A member 3-like n=1 Tax=Zerene cesonia TaxID=33412 RepID=UPI0018E5095F|nr:ATP-binding cassette sub-family A member 3-like [Zerene cesonia]